MARNPEETKKEMRERREKRRAEKHLANSAQAAKGEKGKPKQRYNRRQELYRWKNRPFVEQLLDMGASMKSVVDYCRGKGADFSVATIKKYKAEREAAIKFKGFADIHDFATDAPDYKNMKQLSASARERLLQEHLDRWNEESAELSDKDQVTTTQRGNDFKTTKSQQINNLARRRRQLHSKDPGRVMSDLQFLDVMIQKGVETLAKMPTVDPGKALKAIELKYKLTQGSHGGLTMYGMEEIRLREAARENAMTEVIQNFVPEESREELLNQLEYTTAEFYKANGLGDVYKNATASEVEEYLEKEGLEPEEDDNYYNEEAK